MSFCLSSLTTKTSPERQNCRGREGPGSPGDDIVTDGGGRRVNQWIVEQMMILRVKHSLSIVLKSVIRLQGNESSDTQIGVEGASDDANTEADSDAPYPSDSTQDALGDY